jgi:hypothetical protein
LAFLIPRCEKFICGRSFPLSLQIAPKKFQEISQPTLSLPKSSPPELVENDWQPERLPYNVTL